MGLFRSNNGAIRHVQTVPASKPYQVVCFCVIVVHVTLLSDTRILDKVCKLYCPALDCTQSYSRMT